MGMTKPQVFFKVVLFQVVKRIVPAMGNEIITLVKDTSLARRIIGVAEIIMCAEVYQAGSYMAPVLNGSVLPGSLRCPYRPVQLYRRKLDYYKG